MNGLSFLLFFASPYFAEGLFTAINWLWIAGAIAVAWILISAMGRRQVRLTELLRAHVKKTQEADSPPETAAPPEETQP